jgi:hypothetical protein
VPAVDVSEVAPDPGRQQAGECVVIIILDQLVTVAESGLFDRHPAAPLPVGCLHGIDGDQLSLAAVAQRREDREGGHAERHPHLDDQRGASAANHIVEVLGIAQFYVRMEGHQLPRETGAGPTIEHVLQRLTPRQQPRHTILL